MVQVREENNMTEVSLDNTMQVVQEIFQGFQQAARDEILGLLIQNQVANPQGISDQIFDQSLSLPLFDGFETDHLRRGFLERECGYRVFFILFCFALLCFLLSAFMIDQDKTFFQFPLFRSGRNQMQS